MKMRELLILFFEIEKVHMLYRGEQDLFFNQG